MKAEKTAWIDEENKIVSFQAIDNGRMITGPVLGLPAETDERGIPGHMKEGRISTKRIIALFLAAVLCLTLVSCSKRYETEQTESQPKTTKQKIVELTGPWHLDSEKNDLAAFADLFPGYGEWGASMEIRSNGQTSWYIGAEGWHGTYTIEDNVLHAQLTSDLEQTEQLWYFRIASESELQMDHNGMTVYWVYGDQEDSAG